MDGAVRQAIAEITRDDAIAQAIAELSEHDRAALAARLRVLLVDEKSNKSFDDSTSPAHQRVVVRCGDRGCRGVVAESIGEVLHFVSLERSTEPNATSEMSIVGTSIELHGVESATTQAVYCPQCWMLYDLDDVVREVRTAGLLGRSRRIMASSGAVKGR